jgi:hypothetical protein
MKPFHKFARKIAIGLMLVGLSACQSARQISGHPEIVSVKKISSIANHNAFTDLIRFRGKWFCTFRESQAHVGGNGKIRVLTSRDGDHWKSAALLVEDGIDLRDPKLSITPNNCLMLVLGGSVYRGKKLIERQSRVAFSKNGGDWTQPQRVCSPGDWLWRVTWHAGRAYGIVYSSPKPESPSGSRLVESDDGIHFRTIASLNIPDFPNEATVRFAKNGNCIALVRRDSGDKNAWIGESAPPYKIWNWKSAGMFVGGPNFIILPDNSMIVAGRQMNPPPVGAKTFVGKMTTDSITPELILPSGGDCSYPGLVWRNGLLWMSYYSSHEGRTSIYLAKIKFR